MRENYSQARDILRKHAESVQWFGLLEFCHSDRREEPACLRQGTRKQIPHGFAVRNDKGALKEKRWPRPVLRRFR